MVRLYRTFSNLIFAVGTRCVGRVPVHCFGVVQPHFSAELARCVEVFDVSSEWFDCLLEPHLHSGNKVCMVPVHCFRVVQPQRTSSNLLEPLQCRESKVCRVRYTHHSFSGIHCIEDGVGLHRMPCTRRMSPLSGLMPLVKSLTSTVRC